MIHVLRRGICSRKTKDNRHDRNQERMREWLEPVTHSAILASADEPDALIVKTEALFFLRFSDGKVLED
jgi:hypothetical protein